MKRRIQLSPEDRQSISDAVSLAEQATSGELVPVILPASDGYERASWIWVCAGGVLGTFVSVLAHEWTLYRSWGDTGFIPELYWVILYQLIGAAIGWALSSFAPLRRWVLRSSQMKQAVDTKAKALFLEFGLTRTRDRTGVLIVVSLFERRVQIIADEGIHSRVPAGFWDQEVSRLVQAIHEDRFVQGLCEVIEDIGKKLALSFPKKSDDRNELSNEPREGT